MLGRFPQLDQNRFAPGQAVKGKRWSFPGVFGEGGEWKPFGQERWSGLGSVKVLLRHLVAAQARSDPLLVQSGKRLCQGRPEKRIAEDVLSGAGLVLLV